MPTLDPASTSSSSSPQPVPIPGQTPQLPQNHNQDDRIPPSTPLEMSQLPPPPTTQPDPASIQQPAPVHFEPAQASDLPSPVQTLSRHDTSAIGPSVEDGPVVHSESAGGSAVLITLLLTTGARHPYKIDEKYLRKRNGISASEAVDPYAISVYTMKELILRDWRQEWEPRPSSPSAIRLIYFGKLLDDKSALKDCRLNATTSNVIHMTVKPQDLMDDEENTKAGKAGSNHDDDGNHSVGCRCVIL